MCVREIADTVASGQQRDDGQVGVHQFDAFQACGERAPVHEGNADTMMSGGAEGSSTKETEWFAAVCTLRSRYASWVKERCTLWRRIAT